LNLLHEVINSIHFSRQNDIVSPSALFSVPECRFSSLSPFCGEETENLRNKAPYGLAFSINILSYA
jgi:hypothetical protein